MIDDSYTDSVLEDYYEELRDERERFRLKRDAEACGYIPTEEDDND